jgi:hypothetical protein
LRGELTPFNSGHHLPELQASESEAQVHGIYAAHGESDQIRFSALSYAIRGSLAALSLVHFSTLDACLTALDLLPSPVFGFRLFRHSIGHGDMDAQFFVSQVVASLGLVMFGLGIPTIVWLILLRFRNDLHDPGVRHAFGVVYDGYLLPDGTYNGRGFWWWELLVINLRKAALLVAVRVAGSAVSQATALIGILSLALILHVQTFPYESWILNNLETVSLLSLWFAVAIGLASLTTASDEATYSDDSVGHRRIQVRSGY